MSGWAGVIGGAFEIGGSIANIAGARKAHQQQKRITREYLKMINANQAKFEGLTADYATRFQDISDNFDMYDLENEFDSLNEAVFMPMEREFSENVLPQLRQAYSGGGYGSSLFSGGRESSEAKAKQELSMNKALLKMQGREAGISRNMADYDRRRSDLQLQYGMKTAPIESAMGVAQNTYLAKTDQAAMQLSYNQAIGQGMKDIGGTISSFGGMTRGLGGGDKGGTQKTNQYGFGSSYGSNTKSNILGY